MQPIIYDVAVSLDGFIAGPDGDVSLFDMTGPVAEDYGARLAAYSTAIMGRATYEFGYAYGLAPGQNPSPGLATVVFSTTLETEPDSEIDVVPEDWETAIADLRKAATAPVYLCGGGDFAGWLLERGLIQHLILKRAPCLYGSGTRLFGGSKEMR